MFTSFFTVAVATLGLLLNGGDSPIAKPTCFVKHAYCCSIKAACCGKESAAENAVVASVTEADAHSQPICCMKRAYCCSNTRSCCPKTEASATVGTEATQVVAMNAEVSQPTCCMKLPEIDRLEMEMLLAEWKTWDEQIAKVDENP